MSAGDATSAPPARGTSLARWVPIAGWLPSYQRAWLRPDLLAGIAVAALVVPKSLGYAGIAQVPLQHGLFAAAAGALIYAVFGTSRQVATGPSSALAALAGAAVTTAGVSNAAAVQLVMATALVSGAAYLLLAALRMGWISQFLSKAVITGFLFGAAIEVIVGEAPKLTGTHAAGASSWQKLASWLTSLGDLDATTLVVGLVSVAVIFGLRVVNKGIPGALVLVVGGILASRLLDLGSHGVRLVGTVPQGLPAPALPAWDVVSQNLGVIGTASVGLVLIGFSQTAGTARVMATRHRYRVDINQESAAQGLANLGSAVVQGIPVSTSLSASSLNDSAGARTPVASLTTGATVVLTLLFLAPLFSDLPQPVLAAIIIEAVVFGMMNVPAMRRLWRVKREDFWIALASLLAVLGGGVLRGVAVGVALSLLWLLRTVTQPNMPELAHRPDTRSYPPLLEDPRSHRVPGVLLLRLDGGLFFVTADALEDRLRTLIADADHPLEHVVLVCEGVNFIDSQGSEKVTELLVLARTNGLTLDLARVKGQIRRVLEADGVVGELGAERIHDSVDDAVRYAVSH